MSHGDYNICRVDRVLVSKSTGSWSEQTCQAFFTEYLAQANVIINQPWGALIDVNDWQLATPQAQAIAEKYERWCCENNRQYVAIVGSSKLIEFQLKRSGITSANNGDIKYFSDYDSAMDWFSQLGLCHSK